MRRIAKVGLISGATALVLGAGTGAAYAATSADESPTPKSSESGSGHTGKKEGKHKGKRDLIARTEHGTLTLGGEEHRVVDVQHGTVQSISDTSVQVKSADGYTHTYKLTDDSKVRKDGKEAKASDIAKGDKVGVMAEHEGSAVIRLGDRGAK